MLVAFNIWLHLHAPFVRIWCWGGQRVVSGRGKEERLGEVERTRGGKGETLSQKRNQILTITRCPFITFRLSFFYILSLAPFLALVHLGHVNSPSAILHLFTGHSPSLPPCASRAIEPLFRLLCNACALPSSLVPQNILCPGFWPSIGKFPKKMGP